MQELVHSVLTAPKNSARFSINNKLINSVFKKRIDISKLAHSAL